MSRYPSASVLVPCRNAAETIGRTLASLRGQSRRDFEIVVVDDGSEDQTAAIVNRFRALPVQLIQSAHLGVSHARNLGLRHARAPIVCFLDADDAWFGSTLERQLATLTSTDATLVFGDCVLEGAGYSKRTRLSSAVVQPDQPTLIDLLEQRPVPLSTVACWREPIVLAGGFDQSLESCEDYDLWYRLLLRNAVFRRIPRLLARILIRPSGLSADLTRYRRSMSRVLDSLLAQPGVDAEAHRAARRAAQGVRRAQWPDHEVDIRNVSRQPPRPESARLLDYEEGL